MFYKKLLLI